MAKRFNLKDHGVPRNKRRKIEREVKVDKSKMNEGGFYKGMPGCRLTKEGNRNVIQFIVTPGGKTTAQMFAHPKQCYSVLRNAGESNPMIRGVIRSAAMDFIFPRKTPITRFIRFIYKQQMKWYIRKQEKLKSKQTKEWEQAKEKENT